MIILLSKLNIYIIHIMVVLCLLFYMGCNRIDNEDIEILLWMPPWWGDPKQFQEEPYISARDWQKQRIAEFESSHPGVKVKLSLDPGGEKVRVAFASRTQPDVLIVPVDAPRYIVREFLEPIDEYLSKEDYDDIYPSVLEACSYGGKTYVWPLYSHAHVMIINTNMFYKAGIDHLIPKSPERQWTFDQFLEAAQALTKDTNDDGKIDIYGVGIPGVAEQNSLVNMLYLINHGARVFNEDHTMSILNSSEGIEGIQFLVDLIFKYKVVAPGVNGYRFSDIQDMFFQGRIAMFMTNSGVHLWAKEQVRQGKLSGFDWYLVQPPHKKGILPATHLTINGIVISRQENELKRNICMELARFITSHELNRTFWKIASPRRSISRLDDPNMQVMIQLIPYATTFMDPKRPFSQTFNPNMVFDTMFQEIFSGQKSAKQALDKATQLFNNAFLSTEDINRN